ncbi:hypothetical protein EMIT0P294_10449 [Pseudomonas sp. IT-P294]
MKGTMVKAIKLSDWFGQGLNGVAPLRASSRASSLPQGELIPNVGASLLAIASAQSPHAWDQSASLRIKLR